MRVPLTLYTLLHQKLRTLVATTGVAAAILLIFMQLGFLGSAETTATIFLSQLDYDLVLLSRDYLDINRPNAFPRSRLFQALSVAGVRQAAPTYMSGNGWRVVERPEGGPAQDKRRGTRRLINLVGFTLDDHVFLPREIEEHAEKLKVSGAVLLDERTRDYFGERGVGIATDLGITRVEVVGKFTIGTGYGADGLVIMSDQTLLEVMQGFARPDQINLGLLKLQPGVDPETVADVLRKRLRGDLPSGSDEVRVLTRAEMERQEKNFWVNKTSVGKIFSIGVVVALVVGVMFVYQVISSDITNRFREYATLKAIGYSDLRLAGLVCRHAVVYGLLAYLPGLAAALALYEFAAVQANLPIAMTWQRCLLVLGMTLGLCAASGLLALGKVRSADPVDLF